MGTGGAVGQRDLPAVRWLEGSERGLALPGDSRRDRRTSLLSAAPSPSPPPHPRRCHGFPLLSGSGAELQAPLRTAAVCSGTRLGRGQGRGAGQRA